MNRKVLVFLLAIMLIVITAVGMSACEKVTGESFDGTYYSYENDTLVKNDYITLNGGKWFDSEELNGTYKITNGIIEFYVEMFGESEVLYDGTIKDGVIKLNIMGIEYYYCKEGKTPPNSNGGNNGENITPTVKKYSVTYNGNGGTFADGSNTFVQNVNGNTLLIAPTSPNRQGYSFTGWAKTKNGSEMWQFAEDKVSEDITLYAQWTEKTAVVLSVDGASIDDDSIFMVVDHTTDYVSLATKVVCSSDSVWRLYYDKLGLTEIPTKIATQRTGELDDGNNTFYIVVTSQDGTQVNTYELTIHRSYLININYVGVYGTTIESKTTYSGYNYSVTYNPSITGYTFNYWKDESGNKVTAFTPYSSTTLYADCTVHTYTATLNVNGGEELTKTSYTMTYDKSYSFSKPLRTGYTFLGWYIGSTQITDSNGNSLADWKYSSNTTVTAKWQANKYIVTLTSNNSSAGAVSGGGEHSYDSSVTITANTNSGYTWLGWYDSNNKLITEEKSYIFKMGFDKSFTAKWTYYTLTTNTNNSNAGTVTSKNNTKTTAGEQITIIATSNLGYAFDGWFDGEQKLTDNNSYSFIMPDKNITYTAKWSIDEKLSPFYYSSTATTLTITGVKDKTLTSIEIPSGVTSIGDRAFYDCSSLTSIAIPGSVTSIGGSYAFYRCSSLTSVTIPSSVTSIGNYAFSECSSLTSIEIPSSVTSIGSYVFSGCSSLTSIEIPSSVTSIGTCAFYGCSSLTIYCEASSQPSGWNSDWNNSNRPVVWGYNYIINNGIVYGIKNGKTTVVRQSTSLSGAKTIPTTFTYNGTIYSVTSIGNHAFYGCSSLTSIEIPSSVTSIGRYAFYGCSSLTSIEIPSSVTSIDTYTFWNCSSLTSIEIPSSVTSIGDYAFLSCSRLTSVAFESGSQLTSIGSGAFSACSSLTSIEIPSGVTSIGSSAFYNCSSLTSIEIPSSVRSIGSSAFQYCSSLTIYCEASSQPSGWNSDWNNSNRPVVWNCKNSDVADDGNIYYVAENGIRYALKDGVATIARQITSLSGAIVIPSTITYKGTSYSVTSIGDYAFYGCSSLTSIEIPSSVTSIGSSEFYNCIRLTIYCEASSQPSGWDSSWNNSNRPVVWNCKNNDVADDGNIYYVAENGIRYALKDGMATIARQITSLSGAIVIPSTITYKGTTYSVTSIGDYAFYGCSSLTSIEIPSSVTSIGTYAFYNCSSLTSVTIPNNVTSIGDYAFYGCSSLTSIEIPSSVTSIGTYAFYNCSSLTSVTIPNNVTSIGTYAFYNCSSLTSVTIPNNVTSIGSYAFEYCSSLTSVTIPNNVTGIGSYAFKDCSSLTSIEIPSSVTSIGPYAFSYCSNLTIYCEAESKPSGWNSNWNNSNRPVVWGYK